MTSKIEPLPQKLLDTGVAMPSTIQGCTPDDIQHLEQRFGLRLPAVYREYLEKFGRQAGMLFRGSDVSYNRLLELRTDAEELLAENKKHFHLPKDAFVFLMHQGYEFLYFSTLAGEDPPVFQYVEGIGTPKEAWPSFSAFLTEAVQRHVSALPAMSATE